MMCLLKLAENCLIFSTPPMKKKIQMLSLIKKKFQLIINLILFYDETSTFQNDE